MIAVAPAAPSEMKNYEDWLQKREIEYKVLESNETLENYKALVLCGGADIGKRPERDERELKWFKEAYGTIPVLGICRGMQLANLVLGGTLVKDLPLNESLEHRSIKESSDSNFHDVHLITEETIVVNSRHHQAIEKVAEGLTIVGSSPDNVPEVAIGNNSLFVQWHPEREEVYDTEAEMICTEWLKNSIR